MTRQKKLMSGQKKENTTSKTLSHSRRQFNRFMLSGSTLITLGLNPLAAWSADATPKKGGKLKIALRSQGANDTFDGARALEPGDYLRSMAIYSRLTRQTPDGKAVPELATSFESADNAKKWVFKIRKGIVYSDGTPLKMEDIVISIMRHKEERVLSTVRQLAQNFKNVSIDGENTIILELHKPDVDIPITLSTFPFGIVKDQTYDFSKPLGTGPFKLADFSPGVRTVCVRNTKYWRSGHPYIDEFEMFPVVEQVARANALLSGDVDMAIDIRGSSINQIKESHNAKLLITKAPRYTAIQSEVNIAPGNNHDLRLALAYLMDRERVLRTVIRGYGELGNDTPSMPGTPFTNKELPQRELDLDKAKYHLKKSGIGNSPITIHVSETSAFSIDIGQILQRQASTIGMNLNLRNEPAGTYWTEVAGKRPFFAMTINPRPTYNILLNMTWKTGAVFNFSGYSNEKMDELIDLAQVTLDEQQRLDYYHEIDKMIYDSGALILPGFTDFVDGIEKHIHGIEQIPTAPLGGCAFLDSVWIDQ